MIKSISKDFLAALVVTRWPFQSLWALSIVGLPVQTGLYCAAGANRVCAVYIVQTLSYWGRFATAALVASGAAPGGRPKSTLRGRHFALLGVLTGLILVAMGLLRFGFLADLISKPVLTGFGGRWSAAYPDPWPDLWRPYR